MSSKKVATWDEMLAQSDLPADDFTWTDGSNYGMDGFDYLQTENEGVLDGARLPEVKGMSGLPEGVLASEVDGFDLSFVDSDPLHVVENGVNLGAFLKEGAWPGMDVEDEGVDISLVDLSWLDPTQEQDPARLPKEHRPDQPPLKSTMELEEAWGANRRTDGIYLVPNKDKEIADYERSIQSPPPALPGAKKASAEDLRDAVCRALRRAHYGHDLSAIKQELVDTLGYEAVKVRAAVQKIEEEYGLLGTVFVRAAAFPGIKNGKWAKELKRTARTARYVVTDDPAVASKLGMVQVTEVPWKKALAHYAPRLQAAGYRVASGDPKEALRRAFLSGPAAAQIEPGHKPIEVRPADTISSEQAHKTLASAPKPVAEKVASPEVRIQEKKRQAVLNEIMAWVKAGKLSQEDALRLRSSSVDALTLKTAALALVQAVGDHRVYDGLGAHLPKDAQLRRQAAFASLAEKEAAVEAGLRQKLSVRLAKAVKAGLLTKAEVERILSMDKKATELDRIATMAIQVAEQHRRIELPIVETKEYEGTAFEAVTASVSETPDFNEEQKMVLAAAKASGIKASEFWGLLRWARRQMTEGMMGRDFDQMLRSWWSKPVRQAAKHLLGQLREQHEGLSGNIYVDASAYASPTGAKGCEEGALKHRANTIPVVLEMPRCASCIHVRVMKDGRRRCGVYNKFLASEPPVDDPKAVQSEAIRMANASDAEVTASLFNPNEFNLQSQFDGDLTLDNTPSIEKLGEILFGGLELGEGK